MKKPILCGGAALLMTGLTVFSVLTQAEPRLGLELPAPLIVVQHDVPAPATIETSQQAKAPSARLPG